MTNTELKAKVTELKELQALIEEAQQQADTIRAELKAYMIETETQEMMVDLFKVRYTPVISSRFDAKAFRAIHGSLYEMYCKPVTSMRLTVA